MTPTQAAAVERLRRIASGESPESVYERTPVTARLLLACDRDDVSNLYLAEHPADDDEPVTIASLQQQLAEAQAEKDDVCEKLHIQVEENDAIRKHVAELQRDAERYRWLRIDKGWANIIRVVRQHPEYRQESLFEEGLDSAIDAASGQ